MGKSIVRKHLASWDDLNTPDPAPFPPGPQGTTLPLTLVEEGRRSSTEKKALVNGLPNLECVSRHVMADFLIELHHGLLRPGASPTPVGNHKASHNSHHDHPQGHRHGDRDAHDQRCVVVVAMAAFVASRS